MVEYIEKDKAIEAVLDLHTDHRVSWKDAVVDTLAAMPSAQPKPQWIPFKLRPLTEEEQEEHPEWDCILDCKLPDDGQEILVTYDINDCRGVLYDEFCSDDGSYLDSGKEIGEEVIAWMPLPEPYKEEQ